MLVLESVHVDVPKGYIYFAVFFSLIIEILNLRMRRKQLKPVALKRRIKDEIQENNLDSKERQTA